MNVEEEDDFIKDLTKTQEWEHSASVAMDGRYVALWNAKKSCKFTCSQVKTLEIHLKKSQEKVAKCGMLVTECKGRLRDVGLVCTIEHISGMRNSAL